MDCIFCKIIKKEVTADIVFENKKILAFTTIEPLAPVHILIIPKKHIESINDLQENDASLMGEMIMIAKNIAKGLKISEKGYKLLFRVGKHGGQEVPHIHLHLIGGGNMFERIGLK